MIPTLFSWFMFNIIVGGIAFIIFFIPGLNLIGIPISLGIMLIVNAIFFFTFIGKVGYGSNNIIRNMRRQMSPPRRVIRRRRRRRRR